MLRPLVIDHDENDGLCDDRVRTADDVAGPFDSPLKTRNVRLAADPQNPKARRQITCFYYRFIVIKQVDYGEVGAGRLALLPSSRAIATQCHEERELLEYVVPADTWSGYFKGVKADYAFFDAPDGIMADLGSWFCDSTTARRSSKMSRSTASNPLIMQKA